MADETIDVKGLTCPRPLVETKKKLKTMQMGKTLDIVGDHGPSKKEIPEMMMEQGQEILYVKDEGKGWRIGIRKKV